MATLDEILCGAPGNVAACRGELDSCRMALAAANEKHAACYNILVRERQRHIDCSQAYKSLYEQNGQMVNEMHGLTTTNISLRQELEGAYKTIEASQTRNVELERLLNGMAQATNETGPVAEHSGSDTTEGLEKRATTEEEFREALLSASNHTVAAGENQQELGRMNMTASSTVEEQSTPFIGSDNGGDHRSRKKQKALKGLRRQEARKSKQLRPKNPDLKIECI